jgi:hypothetical protein
LQHHVTTDEHGLDITGVCPHEHEFSGIGFRVVLSK